MGYWQNTECSVFLVVKCSKRKRTKWLVVVQSTESITERKEERVISVSSIVIIIVVVGSNTLFYVRSKVFYVAFKVDQVRPALIVTKNELSLLNIHVNRIDAYGT